MQSDAKKRRFATKKQEVQSLFLGGFSEHQVSAATGVHRRNVYHYVSTASSPRAVPRELSKNEMDEYVKQVGQPLYMSTAPDSHITAPDSHVVGCMNIIGSAGTALKKHRAKLEACGAPTDDVQDVEHYYEKRLNALKRRS